MTKIYKKTLKIKKFRNIKTLKMNGGSRSTGRSTGSVNNNHIERMMSQLPHPSSTIPELSKVHTPLRDPKLRQLNDDCAIAADNIEILLKAMENDKKLFKDKKQDKLLICSNFNNYMVKLKKEKFFNEIYLETFAPKVPTKLR